jgi:hypothetical protein
VVAGLGRRVVVVALAVAVVSGWVVVGGSVVVVLTGTREVTIEVTVHRAWLLLGAGTARSRTNGEAK